MSRLSMGKKIILILTAACFLNVFAFAQDISVADLRKKAKELRKAGEYEKAISLYQKAIELGPKDYRAYLGIGRCYKGMSSNGKFLIEGDRDSFLKKALDYYQKAIGLKPDYYYPYYEIAQIYNDMGSSLGFQLKGVDAKYDKMNSHYEKAIEYYQKGLDLLPEDKKTEKSPLGGLWWSYQIPFIYRTTGNFYKELDFYKKYYEMEPKVKTYLESEINKEKFSENSNYFHIGELYCRLGQYKDAVLSWKEAFQKMPDIKANNLLGGNHIAEFMIYICELYLKDYPNDASAAYVLSALSIPLSFNEGSGDKKIQENISLLESLNPKDGFIHKKIAEGLFLQAHVRYGRNLSEYLKFSRETGRKNADRIILNCHKALEMGVKDEEIYRLLGEGYFFKQQYPEAIEAALKSLEIKPNYYEALYLLTRAYSYKSEYRKALNSCLKTIETFGAQESYVSQQILYFYSLCRLLTALNDYDPALSYYKKLSELSSNRNINRKYLFGNPDNYGEYNVQKEISHVQYYINTPLKNYPPKLKFKKLTPEEKRDFRISLGNIRVSQSSNNITVYAVSSENIDPYGSGEGRPWISWWNAIGGTSGRAFLVKFEFEYKGFLESAMVMKGVRKNEFHIDWIPEEFRNEVIETRERAMKEYLRKSKEYFKISEDVIENLSFSGQNTLYVYSAGSQYKGVPLKESDSFYYNRNFTVHLFGKYDYGCENCFQIQNSMYPLPTEEIPTRPLISEEEAKKIAEKTLKGKFSPFSQETRTAEVYYPPNAVEKTTIGKIELCIQPELISFNNNFIPDLFDPLYEFAEYRLVWLAKNEGEHYLVKIDAVTGEVLLVQYIGPHYDR